MPRLACWSCGRKMYATSAFESLFPDERRCPRCGVFLNLERRDYDRRGTIRRQNPAEDPGPPRETGEQRVEERRKTIRRRKPA